jgi:hypothetical protein
LAPGETTTAAAAQPLYIAPSCAYLMHSWLVQSCYKHTET